MMSLLNVTVKRASYVGDQASQLNTYVTVKLQNVKSTTVTVKGAEPSWEQDFVFETTSGDVGLVVEVFSKEMLIINHPIGHKYIPLNTIPYGYPNEVTSQWYTLDRELITQNGVVVGSKDPMGHMLMLDCRFELPYDGDPSVNHIIMSSSSAQKSVSSAASSFATTTSFVSNNCSNIDQTKFYANQGIVSTTAYASEFNYVGQKAGQQLGMMNNTVQQQQGIYNQYGGVTNTTNNFMQQQNVAQYHQYNNQYNQNMRQDNSYEYSGYYDDGSGYNNDSCYNNQLVPDTNSCYPDDTLADYEQDDDLYYNSRPMKNSWSKSGSRRLQPQRKSLERQDTLYSDDMTYNGGADSTYSDGYNNQYQNNDSFDQSFDATADYVSEDRQWDSGGRHTSYGKRLPDAPTVRGSTSVSEGLYYSNARGASLPVTPLAQKRNQQGASSRVLPQPVVATKSPKMLPPIPVNTTALSNFTDTFNRTSKRKMPVPKIQPNIYSETDTTLNNSPYHRQDASYTSSTTHNLNEDYNYAYESSEAEAINDNLYDSYGNSTRKLRTAALPSVPQVTSSLASVGAISGVTDSTSLYNNISNSYDIYNSMTTPALATTTNSFFSTKTTDYSYDTNNFSFSNTTSYLNDNYTSSLYGSNIQTTTASVHQTDEQSKVGNLFGKLSSAASALKSTVEKQLPHPTSTTIATTTTSSFTGLWSGSGIGLSSLSSMTTTTSIVTTTSNTTSNMVNNFLNSNKLPPIPTITSSVYDMDITTLPTSTTNNYQSLLETRSTNDNDDSMFSRFNSYESESVPYSTSNDLSMYTTATQGQDLTLTEYDNGDLYGETDLGYDYGGGTTDIGNLKEDLDGFGDSFYTNQQSSLVTTTHNTTSRLGISDINNYTLPATTASSTLTTTALPKTLPPIPDSAYDTQNSNLYEDYTDINSYLNPIITTSAAITTTAPATISSTMNDYDGMLDTTTSLHNDYNASIPYEEQYDNQNIISSNVTSTATTGLTTNHMTDSAYTSDYYDNCQYDYEYTENETDYLASGDIIEKGKQQPITSTSLYQNNITNNNNIYTTSTLPSLTSANNYTATSGINTTTNSFSQQSSRPSLEQAKQQEPNKTASILGQSKSLLGGLSNMIGSSVTSLISKSSELTKPAGAATTPSTTNTSSLGGFGSNVFGNQFNNSAAAVTTSSSLFGSSTMPLATTTSSNLLSTTNTYGYDTSMNNMSSAPATSTVDSMMNSTDYGNNSLYNDCGLMIDNVHGMTGMMDQPANLEPYREDFEDEFQNNEMVGNQMDDSYTNGYYDENQVGGQHMIKPADDTFYNTYNYNMAFNEADEDVYHEQEKLEEQLEEYKEDYEDDYLMPSCSKPMTTMDNTSVTTSQAYSNHITLNNQRSLPQQDSFEELEDYDAKLNKNSRMLQKQETILSEAAEYIEDNEQHDMSLYHDEPPTTKPQHHLQTQESLLPGEEPELDMYHDEIPSQHIDKTSAIEMIHEEPPPMRKDSEPIPTVLKEKPKPKPTAKERWHWAYNKIIMQLNVRTI